MVEAGVNNSICESRSGLCPWAFVYVFFSNGTPFDSPNRSEPCPAR